MYTSNKLFVPYYDEVLLLSQIVYANNSVCACAVSYTHLTLPTNREV